MHRCLGERRKRYESAEMTRCATPAELKVGVLRSPGCTDVTGRLHKPFAAARAARRGGSCTAGPRRSRAIVRSQPNVQQAGRDAGLKLMEIKRLRKGHRITVLNGTQFWPRGAPLSVHGSVV